MDAHLDFELAREVEYTRRLDHRFLGALAVVFLRHRKDAAIAVHVQGEHRVDPKAVRDQAATAHPDGRGGRWGAGRRWRGGGGVGGGAVKVA